MIYDVSHISTYSYEASVAATRCVARLTPRDCLGQRLLISGVEFTPAPDVTSERTDFFGNRIVEAIIREPHARLRVALAARIIVEAPAPPAAALTPAWETVRDDAARIGSLAPDSPAHCLFPSRLAPLYPPATAYARESFPQGRPVLEGAVELMRRIRADFTYDPLATHVTTPLAEAFDARGGVCQDFAHIMIVGLRGLGLSAAYVSGYIRTIPAPGQPWLEGADASHAWVSLWCGGAFGWIHLDPTNAMCADDNHIIVAIGRDYADVAPIDGVFVSAGGQELDVRVSIRALEHA